MVSPELGEAVAIFLADPHTAPTRQHRPLQLARHKINLHDSIQLCTLRGTTCTRLHRVPPSVSSPSPHDDDGAEISNQATRDHSKIGNKLFWVARIAHIAWRARVCVFGRGTVTGTGVLCPGPDSSPMAKTKKPELSKTEKKYNRKDVFSLKAIFDDADVDGSGEIDAGELRKVLNKSNLGDAADDFFKAIDKDGNKKIGFDEYLKVGCGGKGVQ